MKKSLIIFGAGGHGKVVFDIAIASGHKVLGFCDDNPPAENLYSIPVYKTWQKLWCESETFIAVGSNKTRRALAQRIHEWTRFSSALVHPFSSRSPDSKIGIGTLVAPGVVVNAGAFIGEHCILNTSCSVDHDCTIGNFVHIAPGVHLAGNVAVGEETLIGIGAVVLPGIRVGRKVTIGAGSVVRHDVPDGATCYGVPARVAAPLQ
jgi:acetyltransferase EpsM